jgi:hypothetical protein
MKYPEFVVIFKDVYGHERLFMKAKTGLAVLLMASLTMTRDYPFTGFAIEII